MRPIALISPATALMALRGDTGAVEAMADRLMDQPLHVWVGAFSVLGAPDRAALAETLVRRGADPQLVASASGLGAAPGESARNAGLAIAGASVGVGTIALVLAMMMGSAAAAAHGYSRHHRSSKPVRVLWATWWGFWGLPGAAVALLQGFAEPMKE